MKVVVVIPNSTMTSEAQALRQDFLRQAAGAGTQVEVWRNDAGPASIETEAERDEAAVEILRHVLRRGVAGVDALIPWCAADPGLNALRQEVDIPVVGPLQAACHFASMLGPRFSVAIPAGSPKAVRQRIEGYGFGGRLASVRQVDRPVLELRQNLPETIKLFSREIQGAVAVDGADAIIVGCMALFGVAAEIPAAVPIVDPARSALAMAEALVTMRLTNSTRAGSCADSPTIQS